MEKKVTYLLIYLMTHDCAESHSNRKVVHWYQGATS